MDEREVRRSGYPLTIPDVLLRSEAMRRACATRDFREIFRLVNRRTGTSHAAMAAAIGKMTSSRVSDIIRGVRGIRGQQVIERVADGFGIPGEMLGLPPRPWEGSPEDIDGAGNDSNSVENMLAPELEDSESLEPEVPCQGEVVSVDRRAFVSASAAALAVGPMAATQLDRGRRVIQVLDVMGNDGPGNVADSLGELVEHYAHSISAMPPSEVYDEILMVRSYAKKFLDSVGAAPQRKDISLAAGWLSCLLGIAACDMGAHASAHLWCADAERRSREAGKPEPAGWSMWTKSMIAFYQGRPHQSMALASQGRAATPMGTVVHAKLAAQEMRTAAMVGDAEGMEQSRCYVAKVMKNLPSGAKTAGVFSMALAEDPPYTATSLMLLGRFREAVSSTNRVIETHHHPARPRGEHSPGHARALLILALAQAGTGNLDEALSAAHAALVGDRPAWPTVVLAGKFNQALKRDFADARQVAEFDSRFREMSSHLMSRNG
ncbi:transcriptional regulator [Streptomyces sp. RTd22]|uniref:transcriptional regulator n=1 Tax=Streptomyces sp. RTd22 TaxID=1841249 RepID=UPI000A55D713|nr:transcriptional regulator [Streptomyces sp. RTd22]